MGRQLGNSENGEESFACTSLAVTSDFSGLSYGLDGFLVEDPVHGEPIGSQEPLCQQVSPKGDLLSGASHQRGMWLTCIMFASFLLLQYNVCILLALTVSDAESQDSISVDSRVAASFLRCRISGFDMRGLSCRSLRDLAV